MFIFTSLFEGFDLPGLKARACGKPVFTSNVSSLPDVIGEAAVMVEPHGINALEGALSSDVANESLCLDLQCRGLDSVSARETISLYHEIGAA